MKSRKPEPRAAAAPERETTVIGAFVVLASLYSALFYLCRLADVPVDPQTGASRQRSLFWAQVLLPDEIVANWFGGAGDGAKVALADRWPIVAAALLIWLFAWCLGRLTLRALGTDRRLSGLERFVFAAGLGANFLSLFVLALGLCGQMERRFLVAPLAIAAIAGVSIELVSRVRQRRDRSTPGRSIETGPACRSGWWVALGCAVFTLAILASAVLPPLDFDVREYHLQAPKEFYQQGRIGFLAHNVYANMPLGTEMLSLAGMTLLGDWWLGGLAGKLAIAGFAPLTALALLALGRRYVSEAAGAIAALAYLSIPWIARVSANGLVDGAAAFYLFASLYALALWRDEAAAEGCSRGPLIVAGLMAGGAVSVKYPALIFVVLPMAIAVWVLAGKQRTAKNSSFFGAGQGERPDTTALVFTESGKAALAAAVCESPSQAALPGTNRRDLSCGSLVRSARMLAVFSLAVAIACGPWFAKNLAFTGNPTYPLLYRWFDGLSRTAEKNAQWQRVHSPPNFLPLDFVERTTGFVLTSDWLSPVVIPLAALAFVDRKRRRPALWLGAYVLFVLASWWLLTHRIDRFWVPVLPVVALLAGMGATWSTRPAWRRVLAIWLTIGLLFDFVLITSGVIADNRYFVSLDALRTDAEKLQPAHVYLDAHVAAGERALLVGDATPYDLRAESLYNTVFDSSIFEQIAADRSSAEIYAALAELRVSHIYVDWSELARYRSPSNYGFTLFVQPHRFARLVDAGVLEKVFADERGEVYRVVDQR